MRTIIALLSLGIALTCYADDLAKPGKQILDEDFSTVTLDKSWSINVGDFKNVDGSLHGAELEKDGHPGAIRKLIALQDAIIQFDFKFDGAQSFNIGMDPAKGELKKKGHLWSLAITPEGMRLTKSPNKADPKTKAELKANAKITISTGEWHTLRVEMKGEEVRLSLKTKDAESSISASDPEFKIKKPTIIFRVSGKKIQLDNLKVWEIAE